MKRLVKTLQTLWREWKRSEDRKRNVLSVFMEITQRQYADGVIGKSRYKHSLVMFNSFERFLVIHNLVDISPGEVTPELLMEFREFLFDEYKYVEKHPSLFLSMRENNIPRKRRGNNTVVICLNRLQAIFAELEEKEMQEFLRFFFSITKQFWWNMTMYYKRINICHNHWFLCKYTAIIEIIKKK